MFDKLSAILLKDVLNKTLFVTNYIDISISKLLTAKVLFYSNVFWKIIPVRFIYPVKIGIRVFRHVVVEDNIHSLYVHSTAKQVGGNQHSLGEIFKLLVTRQPENKRKHPEHEKKIG